MPRAGVGSDRLRFLVDSRQACVTNSEESIRHLTYPNMSRLLLSIENIEIQQSLDYLGTVIQSNEVFGLSGYAAALVAVGGNGGG
jgi:hypothetical protein